MTNLVIISYIMFTNSVTNVVPNVSPTLGDGSRARVEEVVTVIGGQAALGFQLPEGLAQLPQPMPFLLSVTTNQFLIPILQPQKNKL